MTTTSMGFTWAKGSFVTSIERFFVDAAKWRAVLASPRRREAAQAVAMGVGMVLNAHALLLLTLYGVRERAMMVAAESD